MADARSPDCVAEQIERLRVVKPQVPEFSLFGDDNHAAIDAQAMVLREVCTAESAAARCTSEPSQYVLDCARLARRWLDGSRQEGPAQDWEGTAE